MERCYSDGIPDEIPEALSKSLRAPSYKTIAMAILKNDLSFHSLGFDIKESEYYFELKKLNAPVEYKKQIDLF